MTEFKVITSPTDLDLEMIYKFLNQDAGWSKGIPRYIFDRAVSNSLCFGGFLGQQQIAFARVISDYATFANLVDVFVLPEYRGHGYSKVLLSEILLHPDLQGLRRFTLATADAHSLYAQFGFTAPQRPNSLMERYFPEIYRLEQV
ncbi:GNAT family N-acetyltransferase [Acinetobacter baumannii]